MEILSSIGMTLLTDFIIEKAKKLFDHITNINVEKKQGRKDSQ